MAYEFKRLSDVNAIEAMSNNTNVIAEENGEIVKLPADSIVPKNVVFKDDLKVFIKSINGQTPDASGNLYLALDIDIPEPFTYYCNLDEEQDYKTLYYDDGYDEGEGGPVWSYNFDTINIGVDIVEYGYDGNICQSIIMGKSYDNRHTIWFMDYEGVVHIAILPEQLEQ